MQEAGRELEEQLAHVKAAHSECREREERLRGEATLVHADLARLRLQLEHTATVSGDSQVRGRRLAGRDVMGHV